MNIGTIIYGFCNGYFGREDYETKIIVFETECSICCRYIDIDDELWNKKGWLACANFDSAEEKQKHINNWSSLGGSNE